MTNEQREFLSTIEPIDTSASLERLEAIRQQARAEVEQEVRERLASKPSPQQEDQ